MKLKVSKKFDWKETRIDSILQYIEPRIEINDKTLYSLIKVKRNHGGLEVREKLFGNQFKTKKQYRVILNSFIISRVQCWHKAFAFVNETSENMIASTNYDQFKITSKTDKKFFWWLSHSPTFVKTIRDSAKGVDIEKMVFDRNKWLETKILIPELSEQKKIVFRIEELFSKIDSTKQSLEHTKLQLEQYRHSLLKSAFEGKLTEKWREQNNIKQGYRSDVLGNLILFSKNGFTGKPNESKKGIPRLGIETITQSDSIYVNETMHKFIEIPTSKIDTYRAKEGDLFVCRQNGNQNYVGKCAIFKEIISPMIFSDSLIQFRVNMKLIFPAYLAFFINSHLGNNQLEKFRTTTAGNFSINGTNMKKIIIEHPSIEEQKQIVSQIEQDFSLIENTSQIVNSTLQQLETMKISILKQAFSGKLVS